jgi:hypothetical protein
VKQFRKLIGCVLMLALFMCGCSEIPPPPPERTVYPTFQTTSIKGLVKDAANVPIAGATVRIQTTQIHTLSDKQGGFRLDLSEALGPVTISAWKDGYYCGKIEEIVPSSEPITIHLIQYQTNDNPDYVWVPPIGEGSCYSCKPAVTQIWLDNDTHAGSAKNLRFLTMYNGSDVDGNQSPPTRYGFIRDYGSFQLPPDTSQPYFGPGYKLDFPGTVGNCSACHIPSVAIDNPYGIDPNLISGVDSYGIHCDFCHKIADVTLDSSTGLPFPNMPGVLSMDIRRPFPEDPERYQLFFGTFDDDNVPEEDTYLPLMEESEFCAPCHFGVFWDQIIYNSFGEWLNSPYSNSLTGQTCQDCHMPSPSVINDIPVTNVAEGSGGVERDPLAIHAHTFPGAMSEELLQNAVTMQIKTERKDSKIFVSVTITNDKTGHHIPTDFPLRNMLLLVEALDQDGQALNFEDGPVIPDWGGVGKPEEDYYAGLPGKVYARILQEVWTGVSPTGAYWNPTRELSDSRLAAMESDKSEYIFTTPEEGEAKITVTLLFRRAFIELMDQKAWDVPDIVMEEQTIILP